MISKSYLTYHANETEFDNAEVTHESVLSNIHVNSEYKIKMEYKCHIIVRKRKRKKKLHGLTTLYTYF